MTSPRDLCTVAQVKLYSPNVQGNQLDELLGELVTTESLFIETYLNRHLVDEGVDIVDTHDGEGGHMLPLNCFPIKSISSVSVDGQSWPASTGRAVPGFTFSKRFLLAIGYRFPVGFQNVVVTYRAGYPKTAIPPDLTQACVELVDLRLQERKRQGQLSKTLAGEQVTYQAREMPASIAERLSDYRSYITGSSQNG